MTSVFSTHVEVFLLNCCTKSIGVGFLHARGGVSDVNVLAERIDPFSPRTWRCFWEAVVFLHLPESFLHARGGVSQREIDKENRWEVFSTHVEVFLYRLVY